MWRQRNAIGKIVHFGQAHFDEWDDQMFLANALCQTCSAEVHAHRWHDASSGGGSTNCSTICCGTSCRGSYLHICTDCAMSTSAAKKALPFK